jgi:hypothetical protein
MDSYKNKKVELSLVQKLGLYSVKSVQETKCINPLVLRKGFGWS